jgi:Holliday junction resolvase
MKMKKDNKKTSRTRRERGYAFENGIARLFNSIPSWTARRLGSPSTGLPDVMCINNSRSTMIAVEAKSTRQDMAYVPRDQVERCMEWVGHFQGYDVKKVMLAFKFGQVPGKRRLRYFYKAFPAGSAAGAVKCDYDGNLWTRPDTWTGGAWKEGSSWVRTSMGDLKIE